MKTYIALILYGLLAVFGAIGADFAIQSVTADASGNLRVRYVSDPSSYYILYRGSDIEEINTPRQLKLGQTGVQQIEDTTTGDSQGFFRIQKILVSEPSDIDSDGIDDVYEALHPDFLNPLNPSDAAQDFDHDGKTNQQEYESFEDPALAAVANVTASETTVFAAPVALAKTGQLDSQGRTLIGMTFPPSINDNGYVVFSGRIRDATQTEKDNIFSASLSGADVRPLMRSDWEMPQSGDNNIFKAPQINNRNVLIAWHRIVADVRSTVFNGVTPQIIQSFPVFSWVQKWSATTTGPPLETIAMGDSGAGDIPLLIASSARPDWAQTSWDIGTPWIGVHGRLSASSPAINNSGQTVFCALNGPNYLATDVADTPASAVQLPGNPVRPKIADDGMVVAEFEVGNVKSVRIFSHDLTRSQDLASTTSGFSDIGPWVNCSDDGSVITFYGNLTVVGTAFSGVTPGPGIFAFVRMFATTQRDDCGNPITPGDGVGDEWKLVRIAGVSGNGHLDPGEVNLSQSGGVSDAGPIGGFSLSDQSGAGNQREIVYLARSTNGNQIVCVSPLSVSGKEISVGPPQVVASQNTRFVDRDGNLVNDPIQRISLHDPINNNPSPAVTFQVDGASGKSYAVTAEEHLHLKSHDKLLRGCVPDVTSGTQFELRIRNKTTGETLPTSRICPAGFEGQCGILGEVNPFVYGKKDDILSYDELLRLAANPSAEQHPVVWVREQDAVTGKSCLAFYALFQDYGTIEIVTHRQIGAATLDILSEHQLTAQAEVHSLIESVDAFVSHPRADIPRPPHNGIANRSLTTKVLAVLFDALDNRAATIIGSIDGFRDGIISDAKTIPTLIEATPYLALFVGAAGGVVIAAELAPIPTTILLGYLAGQVIVNIWNPVRCAFKSLPRTVENLWRDSNKTVDPALQSLWIDTTEGSRDGYKVGYLFGFGCEQLVLLGGIIELGKGLGKAVAEVIEVAKSSGAFAALIEASGPTRAAIWKGSNAIRYQVARFLNRSTLTAWMIRLGVELDTPVELTLGKKAAEVIVDRYNLFSSGTQEFIARAIVKSGPEIGSALAKRCPDLLELLPASLITDEVGKGFADIYPRLFRQISAIGEVEDYFSKLDIAFKGDKARLAEAIAAYANPASKVDKDLLTLLLVAKREVSPLDHPELLRFNDAFGRLNYEIPVKGAAPEPRIAEGLGGARYEYRTAENLHRPPPPDVRSEGRPWDFENPQNQKIELKGPVLQDGKFLNRAYDVELANKSLVSAVEKELRQNIQAQLVDKIVVDAFGFGLEEVRFIADTIARLANPHNIPIEIQ